MAKTLELVGERWTLLIARDLLGGPRRFQDFETSLPGIAPNMLSDRLKLLETHGLVRRRRYSDHPPRAEYALTGKGRELRTVVSALAIWGTRHVHRQAAVVHGECEAPVKLGFFCPRCDARVRDASVRLRRLRRRARPAAGRGRRRVGTRP